jgi:hypothetical protein
VDGGCPAINEHDIRLESGSLIGLRSEAVGK